MFGDEFHVYITKEITINVARVHNVYSKSVHFFYDIMPLSLGLLVAPLAEKALL